MHADCRAWVAAYGVSCLSHCWFPDLVLLERVTDSQPCARVGREGILVHAVAGLLNRGASCRRRGDVRMHKTVFDDVQELASLL